MVVVLLKHPFQEHFLFGARQRDPFKYFDVCKLIHVIVCDKQARHRSETTISMRRRWNHHASVFRVLWPEFSVWASSDKLSAGLGPKKHNLTFIKTQNVPPFLYKSADLFFGKYFLLHHVFFNSESSCRSILLSQASRLTSDLLCLPWSSSSDGSFDWILRSIRMVFFRFLPRRSGFAFLFKELEIILAKQPIIFCTSFYIFPSPINILIKIRCSSKEFRFSEINSRTCAGSSLNKDHLIDTFLHRKNDLSN